MPWQGTRQSCYSLPCACPRGTRQRWHCLLCAWPCGTRQTAHVACWVDGVTLFCRGPNKTHGNSFVVCPKKGTRQTPCMPAELCRALFTVCNTRQILYRVFLGLCPVLWRPVLWHTASVCLKFHCTINLIRICLLSKLGPFSASRMLQFDISPCFIMNYVLKISTS